MNEGCVYLVGAGPGDPGLITVRGRELLGNADVVLYDRLVSPGLLSCVKADSECIYVGKRAGAHTLSQGKINDLLIDRARSGLAVVRLKGGDPFVFGRGGEEALALAEAGIAFEVVSGVTAGIAAPACAGIALTHRELAGNVVFVTGHEVSDKDASDVDFEVLAKWKGTLVFYMGVSNFRRICEKLTGCGLSKKTLAAVIHWATTPRQRVVAGTVGELPDLAEQAGIDPPAIIVIGRVVALREKLRWFELRPLFGRRIVVTRPRRQSHELIARFERLGAEVIEMPAIRIEELQDCDALDRAIADLPRFDWIVFTSVNGVDGFFAALARSGLDSRALGANRICTIGPATAQRLSGFGLKSDLQPPEFTTAAIVHSLAETDLTGAEILCPRADIASADLIEGLAARGAVVREVAAYRTVADCRGAADVAERLAGGRIHWITFTSPSTVKNFFEAVEASLVRSSGARIASIGPVTSAALEPLGFHADAEALSHTIDGLVEAVLEAERESASTS
ncbi:MAG: uroporphyrinogen-III C-methyltransferase [Planctomycetes bacterium]|nr:uroporphyrinogen-III C-methyltransferase [Planctomycetota bacterium]